MSYLILSITTVNNKHKLSNILFAFVVISASKYCLRLEIDDVL